MQKAALLVYPEFSLQEVMNLARLFRWQYDISMEVVAPRKEPIKSEEGIVVLPQKTTEEFDADEYTCLVLPGCSDFSQVWANEAIFDFLRSLSLRPDFPIGAICSAPMLLARAGLLKGKKFTASIFMDFFDFCPFLERENYVAVPSVTSGNIVTAGGSNFNGFAVAMARLLKQECPDRIFSGYMDDWEEEEYREYLPAEAVEEMKALFFEP